MSFWSKETQAKFASSGNPFVNFGDELRGVVAALEIVENFGKTGETIKPTIRTDSGDVSFQNSTHLNQLFATEKPEVGDYVEIVYVEDKPMPGRSPMKMFTLTVKPAAEAAAKPSSDDL